MNTPTDDEREALADRLFTFAQGASMSDLKDGRTDALLSAVAVLRRTEVPEPSAERRDPDPLWDRLYGDGTRIMPTAKAHGTQGEPSDAQVLTALNAYYAPEGYPGRNLSHWSEGSVRAMRAALRAAGNAR